MPGRFYAKHTLNHLIDNQDRINQKNNSYKNFSKSQAIEYLMTTKEDIDRKKNYLQNLQKNNYRIGRKYKYDCNLSDTEIAEIIISSGDDELFCLFFGKSIEDYKRESKNLNSLVSVVLILLVFIFIIISMMNK